MKTLAMFLFILLCIPFCRAQSSGVIYDKSLADSLGADDYGMKTYILVILKTGTNRTTDQAVLNELFRGHMENINRLANLNKLIVAGPIGENDKNYRGIFILNVKTRKEANDLLETDPAIRSKLFETELFDWYGSAALSAYLKVHEKIEKQKP